jgi:hypothetical protein
VLFQGKVLPDLPAGSEIVVNDSGYITDGNFLEWLPRFQERQSPGKCLPIFDGHPSFQL